MNGLLSRGNLRDLEPKHWLNDEPGFTCDKCGESFGEDTKTFPHPNPRFFTLRVCEACHKGE